MSHDNTPKAEKSAEEKHLDAAKGRPHHFEEGYDGGQCIWGGFYLYKTHSCSYRYQAFGKAKEDIKVYNWPAYKEATDSGQAIETNKKKKLNGYPSWYAAELPAPKEGDWDLEKEHFGANFTTSRTPYWNQAHHLIPSASFKGSLTAASEDIAKTRKRDGKETLTNAADVLTILEDCLLKAKYNINHKTNMLILPMDNKVSTILRLPKHGGDTSNNHGTYNRKVQEELASIMDFYREAAESLPDGEHLSERLNQNQKRRLELLSERIYKRTTQHSLRGNVAQAQPYSGPSSVEKMAQDYKT